MKPNAKLLRRASRGKKIKNEGNACMWTRTKSASMFASVTIPCINYSNWQMATGRLVFWPITNGHTAGLNRASFGLGHFSWRLSHSVTSQDPKQSHRHRYGWCLKSTKTNNHQMSKGVCVRVYLCACECVFVHHTAVLRKQWAISRWFSLCVCVSTNLVCYTRQTCCCFLFFLNWYFQHILTLSWAHLKARIYVSVLLLCMGNKTKAHWHSNTQRRNTHT